MFEPIVYRAESPAGSVRTRCVNGSIVETVYAGFLGEELVRSVLDATPLIMKSVPQTHWLLDLTPVTEMDAGARVPGSAILKYFKAHGGRRFAVAMQLPVLRMLVRTVAFGAGLPIKVYEDPVRAMAYLREEEQNLDALNNNKEAD